MLRCNKWKAESRTYSGNQWQTTIEIIWTYDMHENMRNRQKGIVNEDNTKKMKRKTVWKMYAKFDRL